MGFGMDKDSKVVEVGTSLASFMDIGRDMGGKEQRGKIKEVLHHKLDSNMVVAVRRVLRAMANSSTYHAARFYFKALTPNSRLMVVIVTHFVKEFKVLHLFSNRIFKCW